MSGTVRSLEREGLGRRGSPGRRRATVEELRAELTTGRLATGRPVLPELTDLFPGKGLRRGASYVVPGSTLLTLALLVGPSRAGAWCGVAGMPGLGLEAADALGIDLGRLVLVPEPGSHWPTVVGTLSDALDVIVVRPGSPASHGDAMRLAARLREHGSTLLVNADDWPNADLRLEIAASRWTGLGEGYGHLREHEVTIEAHGKGRVRSVKVLLPSRDGRVAESREAGEARVTELPVGGESLRTAS